MRTDIHAILDRSNAFHSLPAEQRRALAHDLVRVVAFLEDPALEEQVRDQEQVRGLIGEVDFPAFVGGLIEGVFTSIVDSSIQQLEAYAAMLKGIAKTVDEFASETKQPEHRDHLGKRHPQLATMVLMGINRIVVTNGQINPKVCFDVKPSDSGDDDRK